MLEDFIKRFFFRERIWAYLRLVGLFGLAYLLCKMARFSIFPFLLALAIGFFIGVRFVEKIHALTNRRIALRYLISLLFGINYPTMSIEEGKMNGKTEEIVLIERTGGPGFLKVDDLSLVLVEPLNAKPVVYQEGRHFTRPYSIVRDTLTKQYFKGGIEDVCAITMDGIQVLVKGIQFGFRLVPDEEIQGTKLARISGGKPSYDETMKRFVYRRSVSGKNGAQKDSIGALTKTVEDTVREVVRMYLNTHLVDQVTAPRHHLSEPRQEIAGQLLSPKTQARLAAFGAELTWVDIGFFEIPDEKEDGQRLKTWKAGWMGRAQVTKAHGEAQRLANREIGRAEAQAEMLNSIIHALDDVGLTGEASENLQNVVLVRTAQILESMTSLYKEFDGGDGEDGDEKKKEKEKEAKKSTEKKKAEGS